MLYLIATYLLNIVDYVFTAYWVHEFGIEIEANPIGRWMFENNVAWVYKIFIVGALLILLQLLLKRVPKIAWIVYTLLITYSIVCLYHLVILIQVILIMN